MKLPTHINRPTPIARADQRIDDRLVESLAEQYRRAARQTDWAMAGGTIALILIALVW